MSSGLTLPGCSNSWSSKDRGTLEFVRHAPVHRQVEADPGGENLVDDVLAAIRKRHPLSRRRGRPETPADVAFVTTASRPSTEPSLALQQWVCIT